MVSPERSPTPDKKLLFQGIQYKVQDIIYETRNTRPLIRLIEYHGSIPEIVVRFDQGRILMTGCAKQSYLPELNFEIIANNLTKQPLYDDLWNDITVKGDSTLIEKLKQKDYTAKQIRSMGTVSINCESLPEGKTCITLSCIETKDGITQGYSLLKYIQVFLDTY